MIDPWYDCAHEWKNVIDGAGDNEKFEDVECSKCGVPGQRCIETGDVFWPAT